MTETNPALYSWNELITRTFSQTPVQDKIQLPQSHVCQVSYQVCIHFMNATCI